MSKPKKDKAMAQPAGTTMPPPGSDEAVKAGCKCPVIDNHHGKGVPTKFGPAYWTSAGCPLHGKQERGLVCVRSPSRQPDQPW